MLVQIILLAPGGLLLVLLVVASIVDLYRNP